MLEAYCLDHFDEWVYCSPEVQDPTPVKLFLIPTSLNPCLAFLYFKLWSWICGIPLWAHFTLCLNLPKSESQHWVAWRPLWIIFTQVFILHVSIIETTFFFHTHSWLLGRIENLIGDLLRHFFHLLILFTNAVSQSWKSRYQWYMLWLNLREACPHQNGWIFGKVPKGVISDPTTIFAKFPLYWGYIADNVFPQNSQYTGHFAISFLD